MKYPAILHISHDPQKDPILLPQPVSGHHQELSLVGGPPSARLRIPWHGFRAKDGEHSVEPRWDEHGLTLLKCQHAFLEKKEIKRAANTDTLHMQIVIFENIRPGCD